MPASERFIVILETHGPERPEWVADDVHDLPFVKTVSVLRAEEFAARVAEEASKALERRRARHE